MQDKLYKAFEITAIERIIDKIPDMPDHKFSKKFEKKMDKMIKYGYIEPAHYRKITLKKLFFCITAALIATLITVFSIDAVQEFFKKFFMEKFQTYTTVRSADIENSPENIYGDYTISVPNGFELKNEIKTDIFYKYVYQTSEKDQIFLNIWVKSVYNSDVNTEDRDLKYININDSEGYIIDLGNDEYFISWDNGNYIFDLTGNIGESALIESAKSVQKVE